MTYKLIVTDNANKLLDRILRYLVYKLKNRQAAQHLLNSLDKIYNRLQENPLQFPECKDNYLRSKNYREAIIPDMNYLVIFVLKNLEVYILGFFHLLENYRKKL